MEYELGSHLNILALGDPQHGHGEQMHGPVSLRQRQTIDVFSISRLVGGHCPFTQRNLNLVRVVRG